MHIKVYIKRSDGNIEEQMDNRIVIKKKKKKKKQMENRIAEREGAIVCYFLMVSKLPQLRR